MSSSVDPAVLANLAREDLAHGRLDAAEALCLKALNLQQHHPAALEVLGEILHAQNRYADAARIFNALTLMQPSVARHWQNLGTVLRPIRQHEQALAAFDRALQLGQASVGLLYNLGLLQMGRGDYAAALRALTDARALAPTDGRVRWAYAICLYDLGRLEDALAALEDWQQLDGLDLEFTVLIVLLLVMMGAGPQAQVGVGRLLADPPQSGRAALNFVSILERLHRLDEARVIMANLVRNDKALETDPEWLLMSAVLADRAGEHEQAHQHLACALANHHEFIQRHNLLFPMAKACDALGRYEEAYAAAAQAHQCQLAFLETAHGRSLTQQSQISSLAAQSCNADDIAIWVELEIEPKTDCPSPIFVVGFPRSGTTLLEQVLDAHPLLQSMDEQPFLLRALDEVSQQGLRYPDGLGKLTAQELADIRGRYWDRARTRGQLLPDRRLVDKNPLNVVMLPLICRLFPHASIIVTLRHPCDTLLSCFLQHFRAPGLAIACRDLPTLADTYSRVFTFWYSQCALLNPPTYELRYEDLATDFAPQVEKLCAFLHLPWNNAMLAPGDRARAKGFISTPSYAQVLEPVNTRSIGRWRHYAGHFGDDVLKTLKPWTDRWGYTA